MPAGTHACTEWCLAPEEGDRCCCTPGEREPEAIDLMDLGATTGKIIDANPFMSGLLGYQHDEFLGKELWEIGVLKDAKGPAAYSSFWLPSTG